MVSINGAIFRSESAGFGPVGLPKWPAIITFAAPCESKKSTVGLRALSLIEFGASAKETSKSARKKTRKPETGREERGFTNTVSSIGY